MLSNLFDLKKKKEAALKLPGAEIYTDPVGLLNSCSFAACCLYLLFFSPTIYSTCGHVESCLFLFFFIIIIIIVPFTPPSLCIRICS